MTSRPNLRCFRPGLALLAGLMLAPSTVPVQAQAKQAARPTSKDLLRKAIEAANDGKFAEALGSIEEAVKLDPKNRQPVFMLAVFSSLAADQAKTDPEKLALLKKATATFDKMKKMDGPTSPQEESFAGRSQLDQARILALEGKPKPALDAIVALVSKGYEDLDSVDQQADLKSVRDLPDFRSRLDQALAVGVKAMFAETKPFPFDFSLKDLDGKVVKLADFKGKVTIVDVWGTWCPPCRKEIPHFVDLASKYDVKGLKIVGINCNEQGSTDEIKKTINEFKVENKISYPCVLNDDTTEGKIPGFQGYPTTLFLDRAGKVRLVLVGYTPMARLETIVSALLAEPAP